MQSEIHPAESAPTRRSTRVPVTPPPASVETPVLTRAERRRLATQGLLAVAVVAQSEPAAPAADAELVVAPVEVAPVDVEPIDAAPVEAAAVEAAQTMASAPSSRRARRAATAEHRVVPDPIADRTTSREEPFELLEPPATDASAAPPSQDDRTEASFCGADETTDADRACADAFEEAARLFSFTGETPVFTDEQPVAEPQPASSHAVVRGARAGRGEAFKRIAAVSFSMGVMGVVGLLTVGMTTPAEAVASVSAPVNPVATLAVESGESTSIPEDEVQAYVAPAETENVAIERAENYSTTTMAEMASESGISNISNFFVNDPNSAIQWPFAVGVPISYGYGMRSGRMHEGVDFTPGEGSPIQSIADGVVRVASEAGGAYGVHVIIDHEVDGQLVSSHYAHLQYGSLQVQVGQHVTVGTVLGRTGNTGRSYGAHTHFEILMGGATPIDPIPWLRQYAGG